MVTSKIEYKTYGEITMSNNTKRNYDAKRNYIPSQYIRSALDAAQNMEATILCPGIAREEKKQDNSHHF